MEARAGQNGREPPVGDCHRHGEIALAARQCADDGVAACIRAHADRGEHEVADRCVAVGPLDGAASHAALADETVACGLKVAAEQVQRAGAVDLGVGATAGGASLTFGVDHDLGDDQRGQQIVAA